MKKYMKQEVVIPEIITIPELNDLQGDLNKMSNNYLEKHHLLRLEYDKSDKETEIAKINKAKIDLMLNFIQDLNGLDYELCLSMRRLNRKNQ